jgi:hypothetical protein
MAYMPSTANQPPHLQLALCLASTESVADGVADLLLLCSKDPKALHGCMLGLTHVGSPECSSQLHGLCWESCFCLQSPTRQLGYYSCISRSRRLCSAAWSGSGSHHVWPPVPNQAVGIQDWPFGTSSECSSQLQLKCSSQLHGQGLAVLCWASSPQPGGWDSTVAFKLII